MRTGIPIELERAVKKCLKKEASERYQHVEELIVDLRGLKTESETKVLISKSAFGKDDSKVRPSYLMPVFVGLVIVILMLGYLIFGRGSKGNVLRLSNPRQLTSGIGVEIDPTWSPDGGRLAMAGRLELGHLGFTNRLRPAC